MNQIKIPYEEMHNVASEFRKQADAIQTAIESLGKQAQELLNNWEGVAEQAFMHELQTCQTKLAHTPEMLSQISAALEKTANDIRQAEEQAKGQISSSITADN